MEVDGDEGDEEELPVKKYTNNDESAKKKNIMCMLHEYLRTIGPCELNMTSSRVRAGNLIQDMSMATVFTRISAALD